jgi:hypothetical protein
MVQNKIPSVFLFCEITEMVRKGAFLSSAEWFGMKLQSSYRVFLFYEMVRNGITSIFTFIRMVPKEITKF